MNSDQKVVILRGLPASGKTTWAKQYCKEHPETKRINRDDLRNMIDNGVWSEKNEKFIIQARNALLQAALASGRSVIIDDTNLKPNALEEFQALVAKINNEIPVEVKDFTDVPVEECIRRDQRRPNYVGEKVIRKFHRMLKNGEAEQQKQILPANPKLPMCVLVDIDGTLAIRGERGVYDFDKAGEDEMCLQTKYLLELIRDQNSGMRTTPELKTQIIIFSGREDKYQKITTDWLAKHDIAWDHVYMRKTDDNRPDFVVKKEMYEAMIKDKYNVFFVLDDRQQVCQMWKEEGLYVLGADGIHDY